MKLRVQMSDGESVIVQCHSWTVSHDNNDALSSLNIFDADGFCFGKFKEWNFFLQDDSTSIPAIN